MGYLAVAKKTIEAREEASSASEAISVVGMHQTPLTNARAIRVTLYESEDVAGDVTFLDRMYEVLACHPGANRVVINIRTLDGSSEARSWDAPASRGLRLRLT